MDPHAKKRARDKAWREANPECERARAKRWRERHPDWDREHSKAYRATHREECATSAKAWRKANPEKVRAYKKAWRKRWYAAHRTEHLADMKARYEANPEKAIAINQRRRARIAGAPGKGWTAADVKAQYKAQQGLCFYCGIVLGKKYHRDHIVPLMKGGAHCRSNLALACAHCNLSKHDRDPQEFAGILL